MIKIGCVIPSSPQSSGFAGRVDAEPVEVIGAARLEISLRP